MYKLNEWVCTDPDNNQWGRWLGGRCFEFRETLYGVEVEIEINLDEYTDKQIEDHISAYYNNLDQLKGYYEESSDWIIAECIFEQELGTY